MGSKRLDKISDYRRHGFDLQVRCRCGHVGRINAMALTMRRLADRKSLDMALLARDLRCSQCGGRDVSCGPI